MERAYKPPISNLSPFCAHRGVVSFRGAFSFSCEVVLGLGFIFFPEIYASEAKKWNGGFMFGDEI